ncbi:MAG: hypothetical protein VYE40_01820 [Myxococcota bacterium]|nr:hypothetical protein [Myxococcota bacterium]
MKRGTRVSMAVRFGQLALALLAALGVVMLEGSSRQANAQDGVITLEESVIKGRIQKPEAFYILQHAKLEYESLNTKPSFLDELVETVEEDPF